MKKNITSYDIIQNNLNERISVNLNNLIIARGYQPSTFAEQIDIDGFFTRQHFARLLKHPEQTHISLAAAILCCDFFGISIDNLISEKFNPREYKYNNSEVHQRYLNIEKVLKESPPKPVASLSASGIPAFDSIFGEHDTIISNPNHSLFKGYFQDYYCYYYPTVSEENKEERILYGLLTLSKCENYCKVTLKIDTSGIYKDKNTYDKEYTGYAVISSSVHSLHCIMFGPELGEFCFLMFRHFTLNKKPLFCRIAEVLSSSSGSEDRRPTILRMFLSNEKIKKEHIPLVASTIRLNYSKITISTEGLKELAAHSKKYEEIVSALLTTYNSRKIYFFDEQEDIYTTVKKYTNSQEETLEFIMHLRNLSYSYKYNKVSEKADKNIRYLLQQKGYYQIPKTNS